ncbi:MAG: DUF4215 domain-containing protein [Candidatus Paceibacterota bacterium]|jgi:hypothetical protein
MTRFISKKSFIRIAVTLLLAAGLISHGDKSANAQTLVNAFGNSASGAFVVTAPAPSGGGGGSISFDSFSSFAYLDWGSGGDSGSSGGSSGSYVPAPSVSLTASPLSGLASGDSSTLYWSTADVTDCTASGGWSGPRAITYGTENTGPLSASTQYTLSCTGVDGSIVTSSVTVVVDGGSAPTSSPNSPAVSLTASPATIDYGGASTLSWASTDASSCTASGSWNGDQPTSGSIQVGPLYSPQTYSISCTGAGGAANASVTVNVNPAQGTDSVPVGVLDSATCSTVSGWAYDPDTAPTNPPGRDYCPNIDGTQSSVPSGYTVDASGNCVTTSSATACWQTPSAAIIDGYTRCQHSGACTAGGVGDSKCLDANGNMEQPAGRDYCIAVSSLDDADCNRSVPYSPTTTTLSCTVGINEPAEPLGISVHQGEGTRVLGNQSSADFACKQLGYDSAKYFQTRGWSSCGDNQFAYDGGGFWAYGDACALGNSGVSYVQCVGTGSICQNKCGNGIIDPGEQCDGGSSTNLNRCGEPTWYCSNSCTIISNSLDSNTLCP